MSDAPEYMFGNRLSPLPESRVNAFTFDAPPTTEQMRSWEEENVRLLKKALKKTVFLPNYSLAQHQARADKRLPADGDPSWRGGELIEVDSDHPRIICDSEGTVAAIIIPKYVKKISLSNLTDNTEGCMRDELAAGMKKNNPTGASAHGQKRSGPDTYRTTAGIWGTRTYALAWHATGHKKSDGFQPSRDLIGNSSTKELSLRYRFIDSMCGLSCRINHLVSQAYPELSELMRSVKAPLSQHPAIKPVQAIWKSDFLGHAVIMNRRLGEHLDKNGVRRAWDILVAAGEFTGGSLFFKDLNVRIELLPGALVAFDGTAQRHEVEDFHGRQRISHVFFIHQSVFGQLGIPTSLPDLNIHAMMDRLLPSADNAPKKRKRAGREEGQAPRGKSNHMA